MPWYPFTRRNLLLQNSLFWGNHAEYEGGAVYIYEYSRAYVIYNCSFLNNQVNSKHGKGGALAVQTLFELHVNSSIFSNNTAVYGGAVLTQAINVFIIHSSFMENIANYGGSILSNDSNITLTELTVFNNTAIVNGGGVFLFHSRLNLNGKLKFTNNKAMSKSGMGGAIFVQDRIEDCKLKVNSCSILWTDQIKLIFVNNYANSGPVIFGGMIDRCFNPKEQLLISSVADKIVTDGSKYDFNSGKVTSYAVQLCYCENNISYCELRSINTTLALGQTLKTNIACVDQLQMPVPCIVKSEYEGTEFELGQGQSLKRITGCEELAFNAYSKWQNSSVLRMRGEMFCNQDKWNTLRILVSIRHCPYGFQKMKDRCQCDSHLNDSFDIVVCDIDTGVITIQEVGWFSYSGGYLRIHKNCPLNYCSSNTNGIHPSNPDTQCANFRSGILCGRCVANYSVVLGSWKCMKCSHLSRYNFIWLTVVVALAGVVLVVFLLVVKMTVSTGTINGLVSYANILSSSGLLDYQTCSLHPILRVFLSWINLDFGIEACFLRKWMFIKNHGYSISFHSISGS